MTQRYSKCKECKKQKECLYTRTFTYSMDRPCQKAFVEKPNSFVDKPAYRIAEIMKKSRATEAPTIKKEPKKHIDYPYNVVCNNNIKINIPEFENPELREIRIFTNRGECAYLEILFVCEKMPETKWFLHPNEDGERWLGRYRFYDFGKIEQDNESDYNYSLGVEVGWYWVTLRMLLGDLEIEGSAVMPDLCSRRILELPFQDILKKNTGQANNTK